jgi:peptidyl-prolyl cis-trans isomerase SurA
VRSALLVFFSFCYLFLGLGRGEIVDRIVAVINDEVITQTDVHINIKFGLVEDEDDFQGEGAEEAILKRLIDQKLVVQLASEGVMISEEELEAFLSDVVQKTDPYLAEEALIQFGLDWDDLKSYIREKLLFQKILAQRFSRGVIVSIDEIERYYEQVYIPTQREQNLNPQPMIEVLDRLERELQREKVEEQVEAWIENLKRDADIQIINS